MHTADGKRWRRILRYSRAVFSDNADSLLSYKKDADAMFICGCCKYVSERDTWHPVKFFEWSADLGCIQAQAMTRRMDSVPLTPSEEGLLECDAIAIFGTDDRTEMRRYAERQARTARECLITAYLWWSDTYGVPDEWISGQYLAKAAEMGDPMAMYFMYRGFMPPRQAVLRARNKLTLN